MLLRFSKTELFSEYLTLSVCPPAAWDVSESWEVFGTTPVTNAEGIPVYWLDKPGLYCPNSFISPVEFGLKFVP